jgi:hypothetical protein
MTNQLSIAITSQLSASLHMLNDCILRCPDTDWDASHNDYPFSQIAFHTLFDCDLCLSHSIDKMKSSDFHKMNRDFFFDYDELEGHLSRHLYERTFINRYYGYCENIVNNVINLDLDFLLKPNNDIYRSMTPIERYINCNRHIQHHAGQLGLRLQILTGKEMEWIGRTIEN